MKICCISDTHTKHDLITIPKDIDILVHAGGFTWTGEFFEVRDFLTWFASRPARHKILVAGNHDMSLDKTHKRFNADIRKMVLSWDGITYLEDEATKINGVKFYGTPWTPEFHGWGFNAVRDQDTPFYPQMRKLAEVYSNIPSDTNVLICHGPVYDILDKVDDAWGDSRTGSVEMRNITTKLKNLKLYICGHIHESRGMQHADGEICYANVSSLDRDYETMRPPIIFHLDDDVNINKVEGYDI